MQSARDDPTESFEADAGADRPIRASLCIGLRLQHPLSALAHIYNYYAAKRIITMLQSDAAYDMQLNGLTQKRHFSRTQTCR